MGSFAPENKKKKGGEQQLIRTTKAFDSVTTETSSNRCLLLSLFVVLPIHAHILTQIESDISPDDDDAIMETYSTECYCTHTHSRERERRSTQPRLIALPCGAVASVIPFRVACYLFISFLPTAAAAGAGR